MKFEWDDGKAETNLIKHGISFIEAIQVFEDLRALELYDDKIEIEDRFICIGLTQRLKLLTVVFCERNHSTLRVISARKANTQERNLYEKRLRFK